MRNINNYKIFGTILLIIVIISIVSQFIFAGDDKINYDNHRIALNLLKENVKVRETTISGGLIAESEEGQVRVNLSVEELLQTLQEEKTMELSEVLFGQE